MSTEERINQNAKPAMPKGSLRTKQHTTPADEQKSHNPMPANHMDTPRTGGKDGVEYVLQTRNRLGTKWNADREGAKSTGAERRQE